MIRCHLNSEKNSATLEAGHIASKGNWGDYYCNISVIYILIPCVYWACIHITDFVDRASRAEFIERIENISRLDIYVVVMSDKGLLVQYNTENALEL